MFGGWVGTKMRLFPPACIPMRPASVFFWGGWVGGWVGGWMGRGREGGWNEVLCLVGGWVLRCVSFRLLAFL